MFARTPYCPHWIRQLGHLCLLPVCTVLLTGCFQVQLNGPVGGATLTLAAPESPEVILQTTVSKDEAALIEELGAERWASLPPAIQLLYLGTAAFDNSQLSDQREYLVTATGGVDYDHNHDGMRDSVPTPVAGSWRMLATGAEIKSFFARVNLLTEADYQLTDRLPGFSSAFAFVSCAPVLSFDDCFTLPALERRNANAVQLVTDIDGDGDVGVGDLMRWSRATSENAFRGSGDALDFLAERIRKDTPASEADIADRLFEAARLSDLEFSDPSLADCVASQSAQYAHQLTSLNCAPRNGAEPITDLAGIENLTGLRRATFWFQAFEDITPLVALESLNVLELYTAPLSGDSLSALGDSRSLVTLVVDGIELSDVNWARQMPKLRQLSISGYQPQPDRLLESLTALGRLTGLGLERGAAIGADISRLAAMPQLERLSLRGNGLVELEPLSSLVALKWLDIASNQFSSIAPLSALQQLEILKVSFNSSLQDLSPVTSLTQLRELEADFNDLQTLPALDPLVRLERLSLSDNRLTDLEAVRQLQSLKILIAFNNQITDLGGLSGLTDLELFIAGQNLISDLSPLAALPNLATLDLTANQLTSLAPLGQLQNLRFLDASSNLLSSVEGLSGLPELATISLENNSISSLQGLGTLPSLRTLWLQANELASVSALTPEHMPELRLIDLSGNFALACEDVEALQQRFSSARITAPNCLSP